MLKWSGFQMVGTIDLDANPSNFKLSECLVFTDRIKQGSQFDVILSPVFSGENIMGQCFG